MIYSIIILLPSIFTLLYIYILYVQLKNNAKKEYQEKDTQLKNNVKKEYQKKDTQLKNNKNLPLTAVRLTFDTENKRKEFFSGIIKQVDIIKKFYKEKKYNLTDESARRLSIVITVQESSEMYEEGRNIVLEWARKTLNTKLAGSYNWNIIDGKEEILLRASSMDQFFILWDKMYELYKDEKIYMIRLEGILRRVL